MRSRLALVALGTFFLSLISGCGDDDSTNPPPPTDLEVSLSNFGPNSPAQGHYELWIGFVLLREPGVRHSEAATAGKFRINANGDPVDLAGNAIHFEVSPDDPNAPVSNGEILWQLAVDSFVTVEPDGDDDGVPHLPGLVGGSFLNGSATLQMDESDAVGAELSTAGGSFHFATPTTGSTGDEAEGVWFAAPGGASSSLTLPALSTGASWTYQGWVSHPTAGTAALGAFTIVTGADQDGAGPLGGSGYAFPGSDFPFGAAGTDLSTSTVFITIEPPLNSDGASPFFFQVLRAQVAGAAPGSPILMTALPQGLPMGTVQVP